MKILVVLIGFLLSGYGFRLHATESIPAPPGLQEMISDIETRWLQEVDRLASPPPKGSQISATIYLTDENKLCVRDISGTSKKEVIAFTRKLIEDTKVDLKAAERMRKFRPEIRDLTLIFAYE
jgi:hypothetical protein